MGAADLIRQARIAAGLTQAQLADRAATSRPTISLYETGRRDPTVAVLERLLAACGFGLTAEAKITWTQRTTAWNRLFVVPSHLPRRPVDADLFETVTLPETLVWSDMPNTFNLGDPRERARCYEIVLQHGTPADISRYVDGALLACVWGDMYLPTEMRAAWAPLVQPQKEA